MASSDLQEKVRQLADLARHFQSQGQLAEAAQLFTLALNLDGDNGEIRHELALVRREQRQEAEPAGSVQEVVLEGLRRRSVDGAHFLGLARLYVEKGDAEEAIECLKIAKAKDPANADHHALHGELVFRQGDFKAAVREFSQALRLNPYDRWVAERLGQAEAERENLRAGLEAMVQAFLLVDDRKSRDAERLRQSIQNLTQRLDWSKAELSELMRRQRDQIQTSFDRLAWHRERFVEEDGLLRGGALFGSPPQPHRRGVLALAERLRRTGAWPDLSDEQIFRLADAAQEELHDAGSVVLSHGGKDRDLLVVESGEVSIERPTPYGTFRLAGLGPGELFGELSFVSQQERSGDAVASRPTRLLRFDADALDDLLEEDSELAVLLYWSLWHGLANKLRRTNEQLRRIFSDDSMPENFLRLRRSQEGESARATVTSSDKVRLFREGGLTRSELMTLATYAEEKRFKKGDHLFQEGDEGREMYIVAEGHVLISKYIPGGGDEALAVLGRSDFFGEMALIDGQPRSADAQALGGTLTVLALDQEKVESILRMESAASLEFLQLLCRLVTQRLKEIDEKVIGWRIFTRHQANEPETREQQSG